MDRPVFPELEFMRLSTSWEVSAKDASFHGGVAFGGRMFQRYQLRVEKDSFLDFSYRGMPVSDGPARAFSNMLREPHVVSDRELSQILEVLGQTLGAMQYGRFVNQIENAEIGAINGRTVLAVHWTHVRYNRKVVSIFIDAFGDGATIREMHFSTPIKDYDVTHRVFYETMRSMQWAISAPPPACSVA